MPRPSWLPFLIAIAFALVALLLVRLHSAGGAALISESTAAGHRLAEAWCRECHSIEATTAGTRLSPPDFAEIANRPSTTALSLKVFFRTSHNNMPNFIIAAAEADDLANYILSMKRD